VGGNTVQTIRYESVGVYAGSTYAWSFYVRGAPNCKNRQYTTVIRDTATSVAYASTSFNITESSWQRVELVWYNATATSVVLTIEKSLELGSYAGGDCYIDACQFERIVQYDAMVGGVFAVGASTYFDGSTVGFYNRTSTKPEYAWMGFPHRSTSTRSAITTHGGRIYNLQEECGFNVIAINEAGINEPNNQTVDFNTADGSALIDIINPKRTITIVGRISGADKNDFAMKMSKFIALFSRDVSALRLPRRYVFQHKNVRADVGVPMTFFAIFAGGLNVQMSSEYSADTELSLTMVDPYFYGHDESVNLSTKNLNYATTATNPKLFMMPANLSELFDDATPNANYLFQALGLTKSAVFNGGVAVIRLHPFTGKIWIGGSFTSISGVTYNKIVTYDIVSKTFAPVISGVTNGVGLISVLGLNSYVACIEIASDGNVWVGGTFQSAGGVANTAAVSYYNGTTFVGWSGGNFRIASLGTELGVYVIAIRNVVETVGVGIIPYIVVIGGSFQVFGAPAPAGTPCNNIATMSRTVVGTWVPLAYPGSGSDQGFDDIVTDVVYNKFTNQFFVTGDFTSGFPTGGYAVQGVAVINVNVAIGAGADSVTSYSRLLPVGTGARSFLYVDNDGTLLIGLPSSLQSQLYVNGELRSFPYNVVTKPTALRNGIFGIVAYGLVLGPSQYQVLSDITYWNGTLLSGTGVVALPSSNQGALVYELPDGTIFLSNDASSFTVSQMSKGYNSSTAAAKPTFVNYFGNNANVTHHINMVNQKMLIFQKRVDLDGVFSTYEVFTIDTKSVTCQSTADGNKVWVVNDASQLTTFTIEPGSVILDTNDLSQTLTSSASNPINLSVCYWPQTFQSIFDGVSRS
jgi:hypothetical protein